MNARSALPIIAISLFAIRAAAQVSLADTSAHPDASRVIDAYNKIIGAQSAFYNGQEYYPPVRGERGSPFFLGAMTMQPSAIRYDGTWYKDVPVVYDRLNDQMVSASQNVLYAIRPGNLSEVSLSGHHFVYLDALQAANLKPGYYDELYDGRSIVIVKRSCSVVTRTSAGSTEVLYQDEDAIYIKKGNQYLPVNSKGSVMDVFKDKSKELRQYLSANKIAYGKDKEGSIIKLAAYYDQTK